MRHQLTRRRVEHPVRGLAAVTLLLSAVAALSAQRQAPRPLDIYWVDVEGGAATLVVTPAGQSVLMDAGYAGFDDRDAVRIERVAREAGIRRLDYVLVSHFHPDHAGGLDALARRLPVSSFVDHGDLVEDSPAMRTLWTQYRTLAQGRRHTAVPGERLDLEGVDLVIVSSNRQVVTAPASGRPSPIASCQSVDPHPDDLGENGASVGYVLHAGRFDFANLGDLSWNFQRRLVCPNNLLGQMDLLQVPHHATRDDVLPQLMEALRPAVAVMNNGPTKGAGPEAVEHVLRSPGLEDLWSLHRAAANDAAHNAPEPMTANLGASENCPGAWLHARIDANGTYTLTNSRNGYTKTYPVH
jgi:beta-lactamase superfamily II metal-dependent hydrolase